MALFFLSKPDPLRCIPLWEYGGSPVGADIIRPQTTDHTVGRDAFIPPHTPPHDLHGRP